MSTILLTLMHSTTLYANPKQCRVEIANVNANVKEADALTPVEYVYDVTFDERCQLRAVPVLNEVMDCKRPQVDFKPGNNSGILNAHTVVECVYRRPGFYYLPPVKFELTAPDNTVETYHPNLHRLTVPYRKDFHDTDLDIENTLVLLQWSQHLRQIWRILIAVVIGILGITGLYFKRQKTQNRAEKSSKERSPIDEFMTEIQALQAMSPVSMDDYKQFHDKLSQSVKTFISRRLGTDVLSCTSMQVCETLKKLGVSSELCQNAKRLLKSSACVRFAQYIPKYSDNLAIMNETVELVESLDAFAREKEKASKDSSSSHDAETDHESTTHQNGLIHPDDSGLNNIPIFLQEPQESADDSIKDDSALPETPHHNEDGKDDN